jgi:hypothetical protein
MAANIRLMDLALFLRQVASEQAGSGAPDQHVLSGDADAARGKTAR